MRQVKSLTAGREARTAAAAAQLSHGLTGPYGRLKELLRLVSDIAHFIYL